MSIKDNYKETKFAFWFTLIVLIVGSVFYFGFSSIGKSTSMGGKDSMVKESLGPESLSNIYSGIEFKTVITPENTMKIFAYAKNNEMARLKEVEGNPIPEKNTIVIGYEEAKMMKEEKLFSNIGDNISDLFGINVTIGGVLEKTNSPIDDFHFVSISEFQNLNGEEDRLFVKLNEEKMPKLIYTVSEKEMKRLNITLEQGSKADYKESELANDNYYPVILGSKEAKMMREEKLFTDTKDIIKGFFGQNIIIVGILKETNTSIDMMHISTLTSDLMKD